MTGAAFDMVSPQKVPREVRLRQVPQPNTRRRSTDCGRNWCGADIIGVLNVSELC
jgi:hypothetical protein